MEDSQPQKRRRKERALLSPSSFTESQSSNIREHEDVRILVDEDDSTTTNSPISYPLPEVKIEDEEDTCSKDSNIMHIKSPPQLKFAGLRGNSTCTDSSIPTYSDFPDSLDQVFPMSTYDHLLNGFAQNTQSVSFDQNMVFQQHSFMPQPPTPTMQFMSTEGNQFITAYQPMHFTHTMPQ
jgi:hypothetical protein